MAPKVSTAGKSHVKNPERKPMAKQPLLLPELLRRLFSSLCAQIDGGHFDNAVKTCDKILRLEPNDSDALQTKLFLLLQMEKYNPALSLIDACADASSYAFEKAYSFYRLQRETEATDILDVVKQKQGEEERGALHLEAQLNYRQGHYQAAFDIYNQLLDTAEPQSEEHSDILTNLQASQVHLDFINTNFLHALDALPASLNLESAVPPSQPNTSVATLVTSSGPSPAESDTAKKVKKVRMARVPAGVVPGVTPPPDPERWVKKSERSSYVQGNKRRKGGSGGATQGSLETPAHSNSTKSTSGGHINKGKKKK